MPELFAIPNLHSHDVFRVDPLAFKPNVPVFKPTPTKTAKAQHATWLRSQTTQHAIISGLEGEMPTVRIADKKNPPAVAHALIVDYDALVDDSSVPRMLKECDRGGLVRPWQVYSTFSDNARTVYLFERPVPILSTEWWNALTMELAKKLGLVAVLPGLDPCVYKANQYYDIGTNWRAVSSDVIPAEMVEMCAMAANRSIRWTRLGPDVDLSVVHAELMAKDADFVRRWSGPFHEGARGVVWWEPTATNPTSALIHKNGVQCFSGLVGFRSWASILGRSFIEKQAASRFGSAIQDTYFDGKAYWFENNGEWVGRTKEDYARVLTVQYGLKGSKEDGVSEVDMALVQIQSDRSVDGVTKLSHRPHGVFKTGGKRLLNTSRVRVLAPEDKTITEWGDGFPEIAAWLEQLFDDEQREYLIAWLSRLYIGCLNQRVVKGHALLIAGGVGIGKTFLSTWLMDKLVGGSYPANHFLVHGSDFNSQLFEHILWTVDDADVKSSPVFHRQYTTRLKHYVANRDFSVNGKYQAELRVPWLGRIVVTMNDDAEGLRLLPDMDRSLDDKVMMLRCRAKDPMPADPELLFESELSYFAAYLRDYQRPGWMKPDNRYGFRRFLDKHMVQSANWNSDSCMLQEVLEVFLEWYFGSTPVDWWEGTSSRLCEQMNDCVEIEHSMRSFTPRSIGHSMSRLSSSDYHRVIEEPPRSNAGKRYRIARVDTDPKPDGYTPKVLNGVRQ